MLYNKKCNLVLHNQKGNLVLHNKKGNLVLHNTKCNLVLYNRRLHIYIYICMYLTWLKRCSRCKAYFFFCCFLSVMTSDQKLW